MKIGDKIPEMLGVDANGKEVKASDYAGKRLAIYFYPKDNTPGCTAEACSLRDGYDALRSAGYEVIGVSKDSAASHGKLPPNTRFRSHLSPTPTPRSTKRSVCGRKRRWQDGSIWVRCAPRFLLTATAP